MEIRTGNWDGVKNYNILLRPLFPLAMSAIWVANADESGVKTDSSMLSNSGKTYMSSILTTYLIFT
jgi:hypothetical protein